MCNWDDDTEEGQRLKNLVLFKFYGTDKELDAAMPYVGIIAVILIVLIALFNLV